MQDGGEEVGICALCCQKHTAILDGECNENYSAECTDPHTIMGAQLFTEHKKWYICWD